MYSEPIDWSYVKGLPYRTIKCKCGNRWQGHAKAVLTSKYPKESLLVSEIPCSQCEQNDQVEIDAS